MKLIDNRYKVNRVLEDNLYNSNFEVIDLWDEDKILYMKLYNIDRQNSIIEYFINNFILLSKIKHENLLTSNRFNIINTIDGKKASIKQYYSITEYIDSPSLDKVYEKLNFKQRLNIILQLCSVLDFLHYRGVVYKHLSPSNIFLLENGNIKIMDLATIYERQMNTDYDDLTRYFIAPEVMLENEEMVNKNADEYSLGMLMIYLLTEDFYGNYSRKFNYTSELELDFKQIEFLDRTIIDLTKKNPLIREGRLREIINRINSLFNMGFEYNLVKERGSLNFDTKIIGREKQLEKILKISDKSINSRLYKKAILIKGDRGVGKTRLLEEVTHLLKMRGKAVYYTEIVEHDNTNLKPIANILRQTIKNASRDILEKYGRELVKILPELKFLLGIESFSDIGGDRERLRLYDRITNYLEEVSKDKPIYLIFDNIENCNTQLLFLLDYIINNINKGTIILIISFNEKIIPTESTKINILESWADREDVEEIVVPNLDLSEIGEFIQHILGISYRPLKFSAVMLKESQGNPRYIEYMMKELYATGDLFLHPEGVWEIKTQKYSDIYFPSNMDEVLKSQLNLIKKEDMDIMKVVSIYDDPMPKNILLKIMDIDKDNLNKKLDTLISMRLLDERVGDWGYSYSISNVQLKKLIYHQIPQDERVKIHKQVAQLLEKVYEENYNLILDELIYHLMSSSQPVKALDYIVKEARKCVNIFSSKSVVLWEEAYEITKNIKSKYKFEILENLGKIYSMKGYNNKALKIYRELFEEGKRLGKIDYIVIAYIGIGEICFKKNLIDMSLKKAQEAIKTSKDAGYLDGIAESQLLYNRILLNERRLEEVEKNIGELLEFILKNKLKKYFGSIYNIIGLVEYYKGNIENAISWYKESIVYFHAVEEFIDSTKPMNNIANIYCQYGDYSKAMEYYREGLNIVKKYGVLNLKLVLLNNIGETYMEICNYEEAKKYIEEARTIAIDVEDINMIFLTNMNLSLIYLSIGDYEQSYNFYIMLKESYTSNQIYDFEIIGHYYNYLGEFYYTFGKWNEALKYSQKTIELYKGFNETEYLMSKARVISIRYFRDGLYDRSSIEEIRIKFRETNLNFARRKALLYLAIISFEEKDYEYVSSILKEDHELKKDYSSSDLDYIRKILLYGTTQGKYGYKNILKLEEDMKKNNCLPTDVFVNILLGFKCFDDNKYYKAINYLLEALDLIYRLIKNIPDIDLQISYIKSRKGDEIKQKLRELVYNAFGRKVDCIYIDDLYSNDNIEQYFDYKSLISIMDDDEFVKISGVNYSHEETIDIYNIETLISRLTNNYKFNLNLILKYLAKETFAQRGYILLYDEKSNKYLPIVSLNEDTNWLPNENLLALANRYEKGILINNRFGKNTIGFYNEFLSKDTKALICIPITALWLKNSYENKERRKSKVFINERNEGYIYMETSRIFNRFDEKRHNLASSLSQIIYMNIENYKLKILSTIDKLTGTLTRKYFEIEFNNIFNEAKKNGESFSIFMIDIDMFKNINDTYGHRKGDETLNKIGECLIQSIRSTDLVGRYGGEEFIIVLRNITENRARKIGEKIRKNIEKINIPKIEEPITVSIGISMFPKHSQFKEELIEKADQALYRAKEKGRNMVVVWDTNLSNTLNRVNKLAGILSGNINQDERNILAILDIIDLVRNYDKEEDKIYKFLGGLIEILEAESSLLIKLDNYKEITKIYARSKLTQGWTNNVFINHEIIKRVIANEEGEFLIDWESIREIDLVLNTPNWQSVIVIPLIFNGKIKGIVYIAAPIKEKEFDYNCYNLAKLLCGIFAPVIIQ